jgi:hypothetical protein
MFGNSWRPVRIAGVELRIDTSWVITALLVTYSLYLQFTEAFEALRPGVAMLLASVFALLWLFLMLASPGETSSAARWPAGSATGQSAG